MTDQQPTASESKINQIKALFAKGNDPGVTPEEAEIYLSKAAELMERYNLDEAILQVEAAGGVVTNEEIVKFRWTINTKGGHAISRRTAYFAVIHAMGARGYYVEAKKQRYVDREMTITIIAQASVIESIKLFLPAMELTMERLADQEAKRATREAKYYGTLYSNTGCNARRGFMIGFGEGIAERIRASHKAIKDQYQAGSTGALVLANRVTALDTYMDKNHSDLVPGRGRQRFDEGSRHLGKQAGRAYASPNLGSTGQKAIG